MAIKDIISPGIGFAPGSVRFIVTRGFSSGAAIVVAPTSGGAVKLPKKKKKKKDFTKDEIKGLEALYGVVHDDPAKEIEDKLSIVDPKLIISPSPFTPPVFQPPVFEPKTDEKKIKELSTKQKKGILSEEEEINLILLLIQAHNQ